MFSHLISTEGERMMYLNVVTVTMFLITDCWVFQHHSMYQTVNHTNVYGINIACFAPKVHSIRLVSWGRFQAWISSEAFRIEPCFTWHYFHTECPCPFISCWSAISMNMYSNVLIISILYYWDGALTHCGTFGFNIHTCIDITTTIL